MKFEEGLEECKDHLPENLLKTCKSISIKTLTFFCPQTALALSIAIFALAISLLRMGECEASSTGLLVGVGSLKTISALWSAVNGLPAVKTSFLEGYASIRTVPNYKLIMPLLHLSRAVAAVGFTVKRGTWESRNSKLYQFNLRHLESLETMERA